MAYGDLAASQGLPVVPDTESVRFGADRINETRDIIAQRTLDDDARFKDLEKQLVWTSYTPVVTGLVMGTGGIRTAAYRRERELIRVRFRFVLGTSGYTAASPIFTLPVTAVPPGFTNEIFNGNATIVNTGINSYPGYVRYSNDDNTRGIVIVLNPQSVTNTSNIQPTYPFSWGPGDGIVGEFTYRPLN